ncbi:MAG: hypothetical protein KAW12_23365 [Candidatus Aminicenantes bacterium]|nr:hypothetical protein [Candidatus Aminicenantes bacterium]
MKEKKFDCVKMMRDIREKLTKETENLSARERIDLFESEFERQVVDRDLGLQKSAHIGH